MALLYCYLNYRTWMKQVIIVSQTLYGAVKMHFRQSGDVGTDELSH